MYTPDAPSRGGFAVGVEGGFARPPFHDGSAVGPPCWAGCMNRGALSLSLRKSDFLMDDGVFDASNCREKSP